MEDMIRNWGEELPNELLDCVAVRVDSCKDVLQFGSVCQNWRSIAKEVAKERVVDTPMLLVGDESDKHAVWAFDVAAGRFLRSKLSLPYEKRCCGSSHGWLAAVNDDWSVTLHKPFSSSSPTVVLPPVFPPAPEELERPRSCLPTFYPYHVPKLIISAAPVENRDECVVVAVLCFAKDVAVFRLGRDSAWIRVKGPASCSKPQDLMLLRGTSRVYAVGGYGDIFSIDRDSVPVRPPHPQDKIKTNNYLVRSLSGDTTYLVQRFFKKRPEWVLRW